MMPSHCPISRRNVLAWMSASALSCSSSLYAQDAGKSLRLIVPLSAGSGTDAVARALGPAWTRFTGHPLVIDNIVGAGGMIGTTQLVRAPRDGQTLLLNSVNHALNPSIYQNAPFDALRDVTMIGLLGSIPLVLVANPKAGIERVTDLLAKVRASPGKLNDGTVNGTILQVASEMFKQSAALNILTVPYKATAQLLNDLIGGELLYSIVQITSVAPLIRAGRLKGLAVTSARRTNLLPELPTMIEAGVPDATTDAWLGLFGPAGLPQGMVDHLHLSLNTALKDSELQKTLAAQGMMEFHKPRAELHAFLESEIKRYKAAVEKAGIKPN